MTGTVGGAGDDSGSRYADQIGVYAVVDPALISTSPTGRLRYNDPEIGLISTRLHEAVERWSTTTGEQQAAEAVRLWLNERVERVEG